MLSRRNIRIKVMQVLYALSRDKELTCDKGVQRYRQLIGKSFELYLFNLLILIKVAAYSRKDNARRKAKLRPTEKDKAFTPKLIKNPLGSSLEENNTLQALFKKHVLEPRIDSDAVRSIYTDFAKTDAYTAYLAKTETDEADDREIWLALYKFCLGHELFEEVVLDQFPSWVDDKSLVVGAVKRSIKALPAEGTFYAEHRPTPETVTEFGEELLTRVCNGEEALLERIKPSLQNWDSERVAVIDMILLKMALCELTGFQTIPTKVTLNEFVEISKMYSTDKSKDFINGILDRLMKQLEEEGKIKKDTGGMRE